jgi:hypothetical protein
MDELDTMTLVTMLNQRRFNCGGTVVLKLESRTGCVFI